MTEIRPVSALKSSSSAEAVKKTAPTTASGAGCHPTQPNRPVCPKKSAPETATFIDPTAEIVGAKHITLGQHIYIAPFARLIADGEAGITIEEESNVQDNVAIYANFGGRDEEDSERMEAIGLHEEEGVEIAERVILAHGATVKGPAKIGIGGGDIVPDPDDDQEVFLSFGTEVDGAILERNTGVSALGRVGPGVILRSGFIVLPGKNVTTQEEADNAELGKVRLINQGDVAFNEAVIEVNVAFAREYTRLFYDNPSNVRGINYDPGHTHFNHDRDLPVLAGKPTRIPGFRNRIIGEIYMADSFSYLNRVMGRSISLRADEGEPFHIGHIRSMADGVIFHALEETNITVGNNVSYGEKVIVHGGGRVIIVGNREEPTRIADNVTLKDQAVVFRTTIGDGATIGVKSAVVGSELEPGTVIPDRVIWLNNSKFGDVEW